MTLLYTAIVLGIVFGGIWFAVRAVKAKIAAAGQEMSSLLQEGVATTARITATEKRRMSRGQFEYFVTYTFESRDEREYSKEIRVSATEFDNYQVGQPFDIVYLPGDPTVSVSHAMATQAGNTSIGHTGEMT